MLKRGTAGANLTQRICLDEISDEMYVCSL